MSQHQNHKFVFRRTVHCGYLIPWESSNSVATPVMQSLKSPVAPGEPGLPSRALEQTKNRLMWLLTFLSLTRHDSFGLFSFSVLALNQMAGYPSAALGTQVRQTSVILFHQYPKIN